MNDLAASAAKVMPPVSISVATLLGLGLSDWLLVATIIYTVLQTIFLIRDKVFRK
jgi:hypothetical protein